MPVHVVMPKLGLTMESGTIARWIKHPGETVREGEPLFEVSTDKINYEVESPASGTVARTLGNDGDEFACGDVIGLIVLAGEQDTPVALSATSDAPAVAAAIVEAPRMPATANGIAPAAAPANGARVVASPAARRLARERGIPLADVRGTGPRGRITLSDVHALRQAQGDKDYAQGDKDYAQRDKDTGAAAVPRDGENVVTLSLSKGLPPQLPPARRAIYRKMTEVGQLPLAQVETAVRVDAVKALIDRRGDFRWTAFAVYAVARLLRHHAELRTDATTGAPFERIDIGIAADTPQGLIVPVVRNADTMELAAIEREIVRLALLARDGTIEAGDIGGACFSISNVGPQGIDRVSPLPDPPQTAILGIGAATQRPTVIDGAIIPAWTMTGVLTFDHRFIDGAPAARFLAALSRAYNDPGVLL